MIILTHYHSDHSGSVKELKELTNCKVGIHKLDMDYVLGKIKPMSPKGIKGMFMKLVSSFAKYNYFEPDILFEDRNSIDFLNNSIILHTPGHTPGSICIYLDEKILFTGDTIRTDNKGEILGFSPTFTYNSELTKESILKISKLNFDVILPGHGKPVLENASHKLNEFIQANY